MLIRSRLGYFSTSSELLFEYHYFQLILARETASGYDDKEQPVFLLENGQEHLFPRRFLFSASASSWLRPSLAQSQALVSLFRRVTSISSSLGFSRSISSRIWRDGISRYYIWRSICSLINLP